MKLLLLPVFVAFIAGAQVWCEEMEPMGESDYWTSNNAIQLCMQQLCFRIQEMMPPCMRPMVDDWPSDNPFREILLRMTRKPRPHQFIGLMGKRSMANAQITHKRHKVNSFVGLMGKRSQEKPESYEWSTIQAYDKRR